MKKILIVLPNLKGGGAEKVIITILNSLNKDAMVKADLFLMKNIIEYDIKNINFNIYVSLDSNKNLKSNLFKVYQDLKNLAKNYDIIIGGLEYISSYFAYMVSRNLKKIHISWNHSVLKYSLKNRNLLEEIFFFYFYPKFKYLVFPSRGAKLDYMNLIKSNQLLKVIYNPIDLNYIRELSEEEIGEQFICNTPYILSMGRLEYQKGFDLLIESFYRLSKKFSNINLVILGEGKEKENLEGLVVKKNLTNRVYFLGFKKNPYPYMKKAKFFVSASRLEGFSMVILEALALNKAVVSTNCPFGPAEILENGKYGLLVPTENVELLYKSMYKLLDNPQIIKELENKAEERAKEFCLDKVIKEWKNFFNEIYNNN